VTRQASRLEGERTERRRAVDRVVGQRIVCPLLLLWLWLWLLLPVKRREWTTPVGGALESRHGCRETDGLGVMSWTRSRCYGIVQVWYNIIPNDRWLLNRQKRSWQRNLRNVTCSFVHCVWCVVP
jgi:hypothetical protein